MIYGTSQHRHVLQEAVNRAALRNKNRRLMIPVQVVNDEIASIHEQLQDERLTDNARAALRGYQEHLRQFVNYNAEYVDC